MLIEMVIDGTEVPELSGDADPASVLLRDVATGNEDAFAKLYDMLSSRVFGLILRVLVDRSQSEEVLQEVFLEIWQSAPKFDPERGLARTWILTIAHRRAVDRVRASRASFDRDLLAGFRELHSQPESVADEAALRIEGARVATLLTQLPQVQREALTLAYFGGYSQSEVAAITGAPLGTVKSRMRDGLSQLRSEMEVGR